MKRIGIGLVAAGFVIAVASAASAQSTTGSKTGVTTSTTGSSGAAAGTMHSGPNRASTTGSTRPGASGMAPGHLKKEAKPPSTSAREFAPGRSTTKPPGQTMTR